MKNTQKTFKVLLDTNGQVEWRDIFTFGQWESIKKELKKLYKFFAMHVSVNPTKEELENTLYFVKDKKLLKKLEMVITDELIDQVLDAKLRQECMYYFWSKAEYEVLVKNWVGQDCERKIDIYEQLENNWDSFKELAFENADVKE